MVEFYSWHCKNLPHTSESLACILCLPVFCKRQTNLTVLILTEHGQKVETSQKLSFFYLPQRGPCLSGCNCKSQSSMQEKRTTSFVLLEPWEIHGQPAALSYEPMCKTLLLPPPPRSQIAFGKCWTLSCLWCSSCPCSWVPVIRWPRGCADLSSLMPS